MKIRLLQFAIAMLMLTMSISVFAQEGADDPLGAADKTTRIYLGPVFGYNSIDHNAPKLATFANDKYCPSFTGGAGQGFYFGLSYEYHIGKPEESISSVIGRVIYSMYPGAMDVAGDRYPSLINDPQAATGLTVIHSSTKHTIDINYAVLAVEVMYKQNFIKEVPLGVTFGPSFEFPLTKNVTQEYHLVQPENASFNRVDNPEYTYTNNDKTVVLHDGEIDKSAGIRVGVKIGIQYELILFQKAYIVPAIYYNYALTDVNEQDWGINVFQAGFDIRWAF